MAKLSFIGELDERQTEYANKIAEKAKEMGIPPALAVSIAYHESRLNPDAPRGKDGEFGIMQVMPATGKGMGFTNQDLTDPDKNIEAGLKYLKQNLDAFGGDPKMATVGYNAGTDSSFFSGSPLPKTTEAYVKAMKAYGAYDESAETSVNKPIEPESDMVPVPTSPEPPAGADMSGADRAAQFLFGGIGAGVGAAVSGTQAGMNALDTRAVNLAGKTEAAKIAAQRAAGIVPQQPTGPSSGEKWAAKTGYGKGAGTVQDVSSRYQRAMSQGQLSGRMDKLFGVPQEGESKALAQRLIDRANASTPPKLSGLDSVISDFKAMMRPLAPVATAAKTVGKYVLPPLAGLSAGLDVADVAHEYNKPERDYTKMGLKAASGIGGALSMFPPSAPVGIPLSLGASGIQYIRENPDLLERLSKRAGDMQYSDPMGYGP